MLTACTIIARNYLPYARVLADSFAAHHPGSTFIVLIIEDERRELQTGVEPFRCVRLSDICQSGAYNRAGRHTPQARGSPGFIHNDEID
jgi:hypothetical protein